MSTNALASAVFGLFPWTIVAELAQTNPGTPGDVTTLVTLVAQIGLSAIFLFQWRDERRERRELQETMLNWIKQFGPALEASTATLERVQAGLIQQVERSQGTDRSRELDVASRQLRDSVDLLDSMLNRVKKIEGGTDK